MPKKSENVTPTTTTTETVQQQEPATSRHENTDRNNNDNKNRTLWAWILAGGMMGSALIMCLCGRGCTPCGRASNCEGCGEKTEITVDGDAVIVNDSQNTDIKVNKGDGNVINDNNSAINVTPKPKPKPKAQPKPIPVAPAPVVEPRPEPKPEPQCKKITTTTRTRVIITGDADDVINAAVQIMNSNCR